MAFQIQIPDVNVYVHLVSENGTALAAIQAALSTLNSKVNIMSAGLDKLTTAVNAENTVVDSVMVFLQGLPALLLSTSQDPAIIALAAEIDAKRIALTAALTSVSTPTNPPPPPPPALGATTTALAASVNPVAVGAVTSLSATVSGVSPTGSVTFMDGATTLGTGSLTGGLASFDAVFTTAATHTVTASYSGDTVNAPSISAGVDIVAS